MKQARKYQHDHRADSIAFRHDPSLRAKLSKLARSVQLGAGSLAADSPATRQAWFAFHVCPSSYLSRSRETHRSEIQGQREMLGKNKIPVRNKNGINRRLD